MELSLAVGFHLAKHSFSCNQLMATRDSWPPRGVLQPFFVLLLISVPQRIGLVITGVPLETSLWG